MKLNYSIFLIIMALSLMISCGEVATSSENNAVDMTETPSENEEKTTERPAPVIEKPDCPTEGKTLEGNEYWSADENLIIQIAATSETEDPDYGESHRVLQIYNSKTCDMRKKEVLPVNRSPDFPYYLSDIIYNKINKMIAIRGFDQFFVFDLKRQKLLPPRKPAFLNERYAEDAQTGLIKRLEVWENYLIGYSQGQGSFVFDLSSGTPKSQGPFAEYEILEGEDFGTLFLLKSGNGTYQMAIPNYDWETDSFEINPLLEKPEKIVTQLNPKFRNNRFLVVKKIAEDGSQQPIAIDMKNRKRMDLPTDIAAKKDTEIIDWMKKQ